MGCGSSSQSHSATSVVPKDPNVGDPRFCSCSEEVQRTSGGGDEKSKSLLCHNCMKIIKGDADAIKVALPRTPVRKDAEADYDSESSSSQSSDEDSDDQDDGGDRGMGADE